MQIYRLAYVNVLANNMPQLHEGCNIFNCCSCCLVSWQCASVALVAFIDEWRGPLMSGRCAVLYMDSVVAPRNNIPSISAHQEHCRRITGGQTHHKTRLDRYLGACAYAKAGHQLHVATPQPVPGHKEKTGHSLHTATRYLAASLDSCFLHWIRVHIV